MRRYEVNVSTSAGLRAATLLAVALVANSAHAQFKCVDSTGKTSFQQMPCSAQQKQQTFDVRPANGSVSATTPASAAPASGAAATDQRLVAKYERERRIRDLQREVSSIQGTIDGNNERMSAEMQAVSNRKRAANNNLAGAAWEQSLSSEMNAIAAKYKALNDVALGRLNAAQTQLAEAQRSLSADSHP